MDISLFVSCVTLLIACLGFLCSCELGYKTSRLKKEIESLKENNWHLSKELDQQANLLNWVCKGLLSQEEESD